MGIQEAIRDAAAKLAGDTCVKDVRIGLGYTGVLLDNGQMGLAYTFRRNLPGGCGRSGEGRQETLWSSFLPGPRLNALLPWPHAMPC